MNSENLDFSKFSRQICSIHEQANTLSESAQTSSQQQITEAVQELRTALEELRVAEEELHQQNEELIITRQAVERERQRYQDLFEFAPDGYLVTDIQGVIREANSAAARLLNTEKKFLVGKPLIIFVPNEERLAFRYQLNLLCQLEQLPEWEVRFQPRRSNQFDAAISIGYIHDNENRLVGWRWLVRNITARKQAEVQIQQAQLQNLQLQEAAKMKSQFLATISHELRTPMNAIIGFSQLLLRQSPHALAVKQVDMVERILNGGKHLLGLIDEILNFSQLEAGALKLKLQEFNLATLVTTTTEEIRILAEQKNLSLQVKVSLVNPLVVNDVNRLRQILINLVANAIKFTDIGSIQVEVWEFEDRVAISVKDTGIGIAQDDLNRVFEEFQQLTQATLRRHGGTGLGLAIAQRLVRMMKGIIVVNSKLGQGSTFRVELPRQVSGEELSL